MQIGLHVHVAGGYVKAVEHAKAVGCSAMQVFATNPRGYRPAAIDRVALGQFAQLRRAARHRPVRDPHAVPHQPRERRPEDRPRLATALASTISPSRRGRDALRQHASRLVRHARPQRRVRRDLPRARGGAERDRAGRLPSAGKLRRRGSANGRNARRTRRARRAACRIRSSASASTRRTRGLRATRSTRRTAWIASSRRPSGRSASDRIVMFHFNDTQVPLGASRDRHWHIGEGNIGFEGFRALLAHRELRDKTAILETPGTDEDDLRNMQTILAIAQGSYMTRAGAGDAGWTRRTARNRRG